MKTFCWAFAMFIWLLTVIALAIFLQSCATAPKKNEPSIYNVDNTILTPRYEFNHYAGEPERVYHRYP